MKKLIVMAAAAGALAVGGAASAQDLGTVLGNILGFGTQQYNAPAVVAGTVPYGSTIAIDQYGRQVYVDQYGRQVLVQPNTNSGYIVGYDAENRPIYGPAYGTPSYGVGPYGTATYGNLAYADRRDRDGDGVADRYDRWPEDPRYH